jgi:alpha-tubulin suppressor-like RCC1 family protein
VATVTGSTSKTVSTPLVAGSDAGTIDLGVLSAGVVVVTANAYAGTCPAAGVATWVGEPVRATVVAGVPTQIPLVLHLAASAGTGTVTLSQPAVSIAVGTGTSYAVLADGTVRAWGSNSNAQFGGMVGTLRAPTSGGSLTPVIVQGVTNAVQVASGKDFACAVRSDDSVICWGDCGYNQSFGFGCPTYSNDAPIVVPGLVATAVTASPTSMVFQEANGSFAVTRQGVSVALSGGPFISAAASDFPDVPESAYVTQQGAAYYWFKDTGTTFLTYGAAQIYQGLDPNGPYVCAIMASGTVTCWGFNSAGQLGLGTTTTGNVYAPAQAVPGLSNVVSMALGRGGPFACAATQGGPVFCAGTNTNGQLGNGTATASTTFTHVTGLSNVVELAASENHTCARRVDGSVACWGNNDSGQLGDGTTISRFTPVNVGAW